MMVAGMVTVSELTKDRPMPWRTAPSRSFPGEARRHATRHRIRGAPRSFSKAVGEVSDIGAIGVDGQGLAAFKFSG